MVNEKTRAKSTFMVGLEGEAHPCAIGIPKHRFLDVDCGFWSGTRAYDIFSAILVI
jgi:hypothetical protein